jgi:hypothetical protein
MDLERTGISETGYDPVWRSKLEEDSKVLGSVTKDLNAIQAHPQVLYVPLHQSHTE